MEDQFQGSCWKCANEGYESIRGTMLMVAVWGTAVISTPEK